MALGELCVVEAAQEAHDLLVLPAFQFGTGDTIALSILEGAVPPAEAVLLIAQAGQQARWREILAEQVRVAAIEFAPSIRVNALILPDEAGGAVAESLAQIITYFANAHAITGQVLALHN